MWYSEAPFTTSVQVQHGWAYSNNINLLSSGANNPAAGSTGTGIYAGRRGSLVSVIEGSSSSQLYVATVPKMTPAGDAYPIIENYIRRKMEELKTLLMVTDPL